MIGAGTGKLKTKEYGGSNNLVPDVVRTDGNQMGEDEQTRQVPISRCHPHAPRSQHSMDSQTNKPLSMIHILTVTLSAAMLYISAMFNMYAGVKFMVFFTVVAIIRPKYKKLVKRRRW